MKLIKLVFTMTTECDLVTLELPSGVWLWSRLPDTGKIDDRAILMPYNEYTEFKDELAIYSYITVKV